MNQTLREIAQYSVWNLLVQVAPAVGGSVSRGLLIRRCPQLLMFLSLRKEIEES